MVFVSTFNSQKNQLQIGKKWKMFEIFLITLFAQTNPERENSDVIFSLKHSVHHVMIGLVKLTKPRTPYWVSFMRYRTSSQKEPRNIF